MNDGSPTTIPYWNRTPSTLDLTILSPSLATVVNWTLGTDSMGSNHLPLFFSFDLPTSRKTQFHRTAHQHHSMAIPHFSQSNMNWKVYTQTLEDLHPSLIAESLSTLNKGLPNSTVSLYPSHTVGRAQGY